MRIFNCAGRLVADKYVTRVIPGMEKTHVPEKRAAPQVSCLSKLTDFYRIPSVST